MNANVHTRPKFLKKITPKTVCDEIGLDLLTLQRPVESRVLYDLFGTVHSTKAGHTDKGDWLAFLGRFRAKTPQGMQFDSGRCHVPVLEDVLYAALAEAQMQAQLQAEANGSDPKKALASVQIAIRVGIKPAKAGKPSATGYEYEVQRLLDPITDGDPLERLMQEAEAANPLPLAGPGASVPAAVLGAGKPTGKAAGAKA